MSATHMGSSRSGTSHFSDPVPRLSVILSKSYLMPIFLPLIAMPL